MAQPWFLNFSGSTPPVHEFLPGQSPHSSALIQPPTPDACRSNLLASPVGLPFGVRGGADIWREVLGLGGASLHWQHACCGAQLCELQCQCHAFWSGSFNFSIRLSSGFGKCSYYLFPELDFAEWRIWFDLSHLERWKKKNIHSIFLLPVLYCRFSGRACAEWNIPNYWKNIYPLVN